MSDHIPLDIQSEIIKRLPVKSVVQCRSVSKHWKSLIDSSKFIQTYHSSKTHLFVNYRSLDSELKFVSIVDDDTFPNQISSLTVPQPLSLDQPLYTLTSANGLFCFYGVMDEKIAVLWNPCVRKAVGIPISNPLQYPDGGTHVGFGVCPNTSEPKLLRINTIGYPKTVNWEVEVFTLSTRVWKSVSNIPPAFKTCDLTCDPLFVDGFIYWSAYHKTQLTQIMSYQIISFDLKSDEFGEVCLPDSLAQMNGLLSKVYESLGFFKYYNDGERFCDVWIMKEGVTKSFTKMLSIKAPNKMINTVLHLRKNDEVIVQTIDDTNLSSLEVYEPSSGRVSSVGINGKSCSFTVNSYMETLLLLDESNSIIEDDDKMTRWDEILSLPVQNPPTMEFGACDLQWSIIKGHCDNLDRLALIPYPRLYDFIRGEGNNKDCPGRFHIEASRTNEEGSEKAKVDGVLKYILYWCSYGSSRKKKIPAPRPSTKRSVGRPSINKGCTCHFIVKKLLAKPSAALIIYNQDKHVDAEGLPCHGPQDKHSVGTRAMYAPSISEEFRQRVISLLHVGISVETIMHRHNESVEIQGGSSNIRRHVTTQERKIRRSICELDEDDDVSVDLWVKSNKNIVFLHEEFSDTGPFLLGIQTEWQLQQMIRFGNGRLVALDSRFGTNKLKMNFPLRTICSGFTSPVTNYMQYPVQSLVVFNYDNKAIPVAWIISPSFSKRDTHRWMRALFNKVCIKDPTWKLAGFIVDDPLTDVLTIREVFQCSVLVCFWRVRHAWHKNIMKRCSDMKTRANLSKALGQIVKEISKGRGTIESFDSLMEDFVECKDFMDYFKAIWYPRIGYWITALKTIPIASLESSAALEFYHNQLKIRLLNSETDSDIYKRADWLVNKLSTKIHSYFWLDEYEGKDDFSRYWKDEWATDFNAWRKSRPIPNTDVITEGERVKVVDRVNRDLYHEIWNPGSEYAICSCEWGENGNLCEHVCKVIQYHREKGSVLPSTSLLQYNQCLINMLKCLPENSLIRDDAVSLAVWVNAQLTTQFVKSAQNDVSYTQMEIDLE